MPNGKTSETETSFIERCLRAETLEDFFKVKALNDSLWRSFATAEPKDIFYKVYYALLNSFCGMYSRTINQRKFKWKQFFLRLLICLDPNTTLFRIAQQFLKWGLAYEAQREVIEKLAPEFNALLFCDRLHYLNEVIGKGAMSWYAQMDFKTLQSKFDEVKKIFPEEMGSAGFWQSLSYGFKVDAVREALVTNEELWLSYYTSGIIDDVSLLNTIYNYRDLYSENCNDYFYAALVRACLEHKDIDSALKNVKKCYAGKSRTSVSKRSGAPSSPSDLACSFLSNYALSPSVVKRDSLIAVIESTWQSEAMPSEISDILKGLQDAQAKELSPIEGCPESSFAEVATPAAESTEAPPHAPGGDSLALVISYPPPLPPPPSLQLPEVQFSILSPYNEKPLRYLETNSGDFFYWLLENGEKKLKNGEKVEEKKPFCNYEDLQTFCEVESFSPAVFIDYLFTYPWTWHDHNTPNPTSKRALTSIMLCLCMLTTQSSGSPVYQMAKSLFLWGVIKTEINEVDSIIIRNNTMMHGYMIDILSNSELLDPFVSIGVYQNMNLQRFFEKSDSLRDQLTSKIAKAMEQSESFRKAIVQNPSFHRLAAYNLEIFLFTIEFNIEVAFTDYDRKSRVFCANENNLTIKEIGGPCEKLNGNWVVQHPQILPYLNEASRRHLFAPVVAEAFAHSMAAPLTTYASNGRDLETLQLRLREFLVNNGQGLKVEELSFWFCLEILFMSPPTGEGALVFFKLFKTTCNKCADAIYQRIQSIVSLMSKPQQQQFGEDFGVFCKNHLQGLQENGISLAAVIVRFPEAVVKSIDLDVMPKILANIQGLVKLDEDVAEYFANQLRSFWETETSGECFFANNPAIVCQILKFFDIVGWHRFISWLDFPKCIEGSSNPNKREVMIASICQNVELLQSVQGRLISGLLQSEGQIFLLYLLVKQKLLQEPLGVQLTSPDVLHELANKYPDIIFKLWQEDTDNFGRLCRQAGLSIEVLAKNQKERDAVQEQTVAVAGSAPVAETATKVPAYPSPPSYVECMAQPGNRFRFEFIPPASPGDSARSETSDHQSEESLRSAIMRTVGAILGAVPEVHEIGSLDAVLTMLKACAATLRAGEDSATTSREDLSPPSAPSSPSP